MAKQIPSFRWLAHISQITPMFFFPTVSTGFGPRSYMLEYPPSIMPSYITYTMAIIISSKSQGVIGLSTNSGHSLCFPTPCLD